MAGAALLEGERPSGAPASPGLELQSCLLPHGFTQPLREPAPCQGPEETAAVQVSLAPALQEAQR